LQFVDRFTALRFVKSHLLMTIRAAITILTLLVSPHSFAQSSVLSSAGSAQVFHPATALPALDAKPLWRDLTEAQKTSLKPLAATWDALDAPRKRKWLSMAKSYVNLSPAEQAKLQSRMAEWAALSPQDRTLARLNFAETKKVAPSERAANWDAYQALPAEQRQKFVDQAANRPKGAAVAAKPTKDSKITPVPVTRHTPAKVAPAPLIAIDRKTLLPQAQRPAAAASVPGN